MPVCDTGALGLLANGAGSRAGTRTRTGASFEEADSANWSTRPCWYARGDLNTHALRHCGLNAARLPFRHGRMMVLLG